MRYESDLASAGAVFEADYGSRQEFQLVKLLENLRQIQTIVMSTHYTYAHCRYDTSTNTRLLVRYELLLQHIVLYSLYCKFCSVLFVTIGSAFCYLQERQQK